MTRQDVIREYISAHGPDVEMLEIGVDYADTWHHQRGVIMNYTGVDIDLSRVSVPRDDPRCHFLEIDSRDYWELIEENPPTYLANNRNQWNLIFIDGQHDYEAVLNDLRQAIKHLAPGGYMLIHDVIPEENGPGRAYKEICLPHPDLLCHVRGQEIHRHGMAVCVKKREENE